MRLPTLVLVGACALVAGDAGCSRTEIDDDANGPEAGKGGAGSGGRAGAAAGARAGNVAGAAGSSQGGGGAGGAAAGVGAGGNGSSASAGAGAGGSSTTPDAAAPMDASGADASVAAFDPKKSAAAAFHGYRWEVPCAGAGYAPGDTCQWDTARFAKNTKKETTFTGQAGKVYAVSIRIRGVTEPRTYLVDNKVVDLGAKPAFLAGGTPAPGNDYNIYRIVVSKPAKTYYLNAYKSVGHITFDVDYRATIMVEGGATVSLEAQDSNMESIANFKKLVIPGIPPAPNPFNGQFLQLDVTGIDPAGN